MRALMVFMSIGLCAGLSACGGSNPAAGPGEIASATPASAADVSVAAANPVTVSPLPGTPDASPYTQISFLGAQGTRVADVRVVGSRSGAHGGRLEPYSTGTGESFLPAHPFKAGERVTVHALVSAGAGAAGQPVSTSFTIVPETAVSQKEFSNNPGNSADVQRYASAPGLTPSTVRITTPAQPGASPGDLFLAPYQGEGTPGPMISEQNGALVWFHPLPAGESSTNFQVQRYDGQSVLTWWQGRILEVGFGQGEDVIANSSYQPIAYVRAGNGYHADLHEIRLTPEGTAWIDAFDPIHLNLSRYGGSSNGVVNDSVVQEIDVKTGLVMWEWHALGHIALSESHNSVPSSYRSPWDYVHVNSISPGSAGDVLLSSRNTWTIYDVDLHTGAFRWRLGDRDSSFRLGPGTRFYWQHDVEWQPGGLISVFDNGSDPPKEKQSRGLLLAPDLATHTVSLVKQFTNPHHTLLASSQGNLLNLAPAAGTSPVPASTAGNWMMGYGGLPNFTEHSPSGAVLLDGTLGKNVQDFRTYLAPWSGHPTSPPAIAVQAARGGGASTVAVSWNGATEAASWQLLAGASATALAPLATVPKSGFQTSVPLPASAASGYVAVQALNAAGAVIGRSATAKG
jgi:Arylsulfotransferase (ASST)